MKILVVEDNISLGEHIVTTLSDEGHEVTLVKCLRDGVLATIATAEEIDAIVTDVQLPIYSNSVAPTGSGLDIVRELARNHDAHPKPVYVHSSDTHDSGKDIAQWLAEAYPTAVFKKKTFENAATVENVSSFISQLKID